MIKKNIKKNNSIQEIDSKTALKIEINSWEKKVLFDSTNSKLPIKKQIILNKNSHLEFYWIINNTLNYELEILSNEKNSDLQICYLLLGKSDNKIKLKINSKIYSSNTKVNIIIISIVKNKWDIEVDGNIKIDKWIKNVIANISEENVFLWDTWKIKWTPALEISSQDIQASHNLKIEKISDEKLFYLRSRWIDKKDATTIMLENLVENNFYNLRIKDYDFYCKKVFAIYKKFITN